MIRCSPAVKGLIFFMFFKKCDGYKKNAFFMSQPRITQPKKLDHIISYHCMAL